MSLEGLFRKSADITDQRTSLIDGLCQKRTHALRRQISKLSTLNSAGGSKGSCESDSELVMTAPPIIDGVGFQALAITNRGCKPSIRKPITRLQYGGTRL